jgi:hypothetical protein
LIDCDSRRTTFGKKGLKTGFLRRIDVKKRVRLEWIEAKVAMRKWVGTSVRAGLMGRRR